VDTDTAVLSEPLIPLLIYITSLERALYLYFLTTFTFITLLCECEPAVSSSSAAAARKKQCKDHRMPLHRNIIRKKGEYAMYPPLSRCGDDMTWSYPIPSHKSKRLN